MENHKNSLKRVESRKSRNQVYLTLGNSFNKSHRVIFSFLVYNAVECFNFVLGVDTF